MSVPLWIRGISARAVCMPVLIGGRGMRNEESSDCVWNEGKDMKMQYLSKNKVNGHLQVGALESIPTSMSYWSFLWRHQFYTMPSQFNLYLFMNKYIYNALSHSPTHTCIFSCFCPNQIFPEDHARFYAAQLVLALEDLHRARIIFR